ncbi:hypothetical protein BC830DRAFT_1168070 [Chytriomyces sp. MP71]|nr:hypothetical protein BC830DRAFT_1168070 [Chytriomyces sp. MP71]
MSAVTHGLIGFFLTLCFGQIIGAIPLYCDVSQTTFTRAHHIRGMSVASLIHGTIIAVIILVNRQACMGQCISLLAEFIPDPDPSMCTPTCDIWMNLFLPVAGVLWLVSIILIIRSLRMTRYQEVFQYDHEVSAPFWGGLSLAVAGSCACASLPILCLTRISRSGKYMAYYVRGIGVAFLLQGLAIMGAGISLVNAQTQTCTSACAFNIAFNMSTPDTCNENVCMTQSATMIYPSTITPAVLMYITAIAFIARSWYVLRYHPEEFGSSTSVSSPATQMLLAGSPVMNKPI